ncbi:hypothetical protein H359_0890 [Chlamydia ibidis 10-1398/6]|uniref:Transmembrane protein n=1 Tax=Chlamydia ibidis 10-1398/6 TaxID=1046581 RepID=A0ABN0MYT4_9CHLA|nr:hypothetical protein H359_0890 [Chlamydia ibidis 10-1398/6]
MRLDSQASGSRSEPNIEQVKSMATTCTKIFSGLFGAAAALSLLTGVLSVIFFSSQLGVLLSILVISLVILSTILLVSASISCFLGKFYVDRLDLKSIDRLSKSV